MLGIINRIGIVCYRFCFTAGIILVMLGVLIDNSSDGNAIYVFYYFFAAMFFVIGFLVRYVFYGNDP